ncbi:MAG: peptidylprolyl isomerase [Holophagales bacterium]|nr:peptidylprolyl isomerase [Holophagales bacterium]
MSTRLPFLLLAALAAGPAFAYPSPPDGSVVTASEPTSARATAEAPATATDGTHADDSRAVAATYRDGVITEEELEAWRRYRALEGRSPDPSRAIEDLVVVRVLASRAEQAGVVEEPAGELEAVRLDAEWLSRQLRRQALPSEAEVKAAFQADPEAFHRPARWRLSNLFLRLEPGATDTERARRLAHMEQLVARIEAGEDFGELAMAASESQTRLRRGDMGFVSPERLRPAVAEVVKGMDVGDTSPILELPDGLLLLRCTDTLPAKKPGFEEVRKRIEHRLLNQRLAVLERELDAARLAESKGDPETATKTAADGEARHLLEARAEEARRRGCREDPEHLLRLEYRELERRAQLGANHLAGSSIPEPSPAQVAAWLEASHDRLLMPETSHLRAVQVALDPSYGPGFFEELRNRGERLAREGGELEAVARELGSRAELVDYGWVGDQQVWALGRNADEAIRKLDAGRISRVVQEGPNLYLFEKVAVRPERRLDAQEAHRAAVAALEAAARRQAGRALRASLLAEQKPEARR